jgi:hypothetical protein
MSFWHAVAGGKRELRFEMGRAFPAGDAPVLRPRLPEWLGVCERDDPSALVTVVSTGPRETVARTAHLVAAPAWCPPPVVHATQRPPRGMATQPNRDDVRDGIIASGHELNSSAVPLCRCVGRLARKAEEGERRANHN